MLSVVCMCSVCTLYTLCVLHVLCMYVLCVLYVCALCALCMLSVFCMYSVCILRALYVCALRALYILSMCSACTLYAFCVCSVCMHALCVPSVCCITKLYCQLLDLFFGGGETVPLHKREKGCVCMHVCLCMCVHLCKCLIPVIAITPLNSSAVSPICNLWSILTPWDSQTYSSARSSHNLHTNPSLTVQSQTLHPQTSIVFPILTKVTAGYKDSGILDHSLFYVLH